MHYYGTRLSENISRREPEGYLLCLNVPVARTGTQEYLPEELGLPPRTASGGNLVGGNLTRNKQAPQCGAAPIESAELSPGPPGLVSVLRPEAEVFSPETIASFEGMPVTNDHPPDGHALHGKCPENRKQQKIHEPPHKEKPEAAHMEKSCDANAYSRAQIRERCCHRRYLPGHIHALTGHLEKSMFMEFFIHCAVKCHTKNRGLRRVIVPGPVHDIFILCTDPDMIITVARWCKH